MKKSTFIGLSILSVFLLCSLSFQPIIADNKNNLYYEYKNENNKLDDCNCNDFPSYPILCLVIFSIYSSIVLLWKIFDSYSHLNIFLFISDYLQSLGNAYYKLLNNLDCLDNIYIVFE